MVSPAQTPAQKHLLIRSAVTVIEPRWLTEVAPQFFKVADAARISKRKREEKVQPLFDRYAKDQDEWRLSKFKKMSRTSQTFG